MATKKLTDYLLPPTPLSGGGFGMQTSTPSAILRPAAPVAPNPISALTVGPGVSAPVVPNPALTGLGSKIQIGPDGRVVPVTTPVAPAAGPLFSGSTPAAPVAPVAPFTPPAPVGATGAGSSIPPQYLKADGSIKTPDEVAADVARTLAAAHGNGDVGTLALDQFGAGGKSAAQLEAEARRVGNTRNDIAVGETDPYKVASQSGIAYTAAELNAIEKAYAGVYDPALDTALAKVTEKQNADKAKAAADAQNNQPFTLGKDQVRYGADGKPIAVGISSDSGSSGTYVAGQNAVVDAYVQGFKSGQYKASDIPDNYKDLVAQGVAQGTGKNAPQSKNTVDTVSAINELLASPILDKLSGIGAINHPSSLFPGSQVQTVQNLATQLNGLLSLENRKQLKGSGAISDFEFKVLQQAASALGIDANGRTNLSADEFKNQLNKLKLKLQVGETNLPDDELMYLSSKGYTPEQIQEYSQQQSFNDVGNTKASPLATSKGNIPQRNNNPGNVKSGGLADSLATGKDQYGHLIFPDAATGFKALTADLTAKIAGTGRLPKNPTIAELGSVYAEDPNWPKRVAQILGVTTDTHTGTLPIDKLVQAVATQEGFYA